MPKTKEQHFEDAIEDHLVTRGGWARGVAKDFDRKTALASKDLFAFIEATQPATWGELRKQHPSGLEAAVLDTLVKTLDSRGALDVLRHGFKFFGKKLDCAYFKPAHGMNPDTLARYQENRLVVRRQVRFVEDGDESIDLVLFVNGFPIATAELKNPLTKQTVEDAVKQYRRRDTRPMLLQFKKRSLVHFAVDPDLVYMTTKLSGDATTFLPFNRGRDRGAGNPEHASGYRTGYLWQEVWERDSFLDVLARFVHLQVEEREVEGKTRTRESLVFPRYHQLDAVRRLEAAARRDGAGKSYLVQHSAGSGKSNSIAWLAHRLASLHDEKDERVFDSVIVVTDRRVLDQQLQANIYEVEHKQGVVQKIDESSQQLAEALSSGVPIVITTLQKFPFVTKHIGMLPKRRYAVIVDEAHSSQSGEAAREMKEVLAARSLAEAEREEGDGEGEDAEDRIVTVMQSRGRQKNLSFFAFTATPKSKTLEVFGERDAEGKPIPFHLYSMKQAIEEGFILDVLKNYTTYRAYYRLVKATEDDPKVNKRHATSQLARFMSIHPVNLAQKTEVMVEHFRSKVRHKLGGRAKAMVVTASRLHAVRYKQEFEKYIAENGYKDVGVLVAFSGVVKDPDDEAREYTEVTMNGGIRERELRERFASDAYQVLLVANKFQTGFDQPLLHTMYVDKRLAGVQAVQTLSRLNRMAPGKEDTFVLDFVNDAADIERSFQPYFEQTIVAETADPNQLYELQHRLEAMQVFWASEVDGFCRYFYAPREKQSVADQAEMYRALGPAVDRFAALDEDKQDEFRNALAGYVRLYAFLSQVMPFADEDLEKLYAYGRHLELKLPRDERKAPLDLDGEVALKYYRLDKIAEGSIHLSLAERVPLAGMTAVGTRKAKDDQVALSEVIEILNERFGAEFAEGNALAVEQFVADAKEEKGVADRAKANSLENFELVMKDVVADLVVARMDRNKEIADAYFNEPDFGARLFKAIVRRVYDEIRKPGSQPPASR
ncbi:MAG TPA: type I restriction endonuclease [Polyangiaceae bacterium]|jgi:type I restriction enzyme R subunit